MLATSRNFAINQVSIFALAASHESNSTLLSYFANNQPIKSIAASAYFVHSLPLQLKAKRTIYERLLMIISILLIIHKLAIFLVCG